MIAHIVTAPRNPPTLVRMLHSLGGKACIHAEPGTLDELNPVFGCSEPGPATYRGHEFYENPNRLGEFDNWISAVVCAYDDDGDWLFICQDDVVFCRNALKLAESWLQHLPPRVGALSLYTSYRYRRYLPGWLAVLGDKHAKTFCGACALLISRPAARRLLHAETVASWRGHSLLTERRYGADREGVDTYIGETLAAAGLGIAAFVPSLSEHIGETSTLPGHWGNCGIRVAADFPGEQADAFEVFSAKLGGINHEMDLSV